ncbi:N-terminal acetyltransferase A, auxiliary subunit [Parasponia andersonii]|uniref:N-terminal acetyltransferase A, auxiliary subunit n=1 Tax=Parasponia andersonii TaxID=3476 RepID=A0A2P5AEY1_PARAD|nr:N-terminal acetyltransferase A, auxiliary subunit [Parasponia andersonii]
MWNNNYDELVILPPCKGFLTPPPASNFKYSSAVTSMTECRRRPPANRGECFHVKHKVPSGDSPYVRAKHVQLIEKDPSKAISLFWSAINTGDRVDSALKDMAVVMKQLNRSDEAIEAIKSFRHLCPHVSQESIDNVLVELYKRAGRTEEEIEMLQNKLKRLEESSTFAGRRTKTARSQGKKVHITVEQERSRILGNLAWAYLQQNNYKTAEEYYRRALLLEPDMNKQCNLAVCLMHMDRIPEAKSLLHDVRASSGKNPMDESYAKSFDRAYEMLTKLDQDLGLKPIGKDGKSSKEKIRSLSSPICGTSFEEVNHSINRGRQQHVSETLVPREFYFGKQFENKVNVIVNDNRNSLCTSLRAGSSVNYSHQIMSVNKWKIDYTESSCKGRSGFPSMQRNRVHTVGTDPSSLHKKTYFSPAPARCYQKTPFTQPRRCLWGFSNGDQRRAEVWEKNVVGNSGMNCRSDEDWRKQKSWENGDMERYTHEEYLNLNMTTESPTDFGNSKTLGTSISKDDCSFGEISSGKVENLCQPPSETLKPTLDSSACNKKKSWADMAEEEDEDEQLSNMADEFFSRWNGEETFNDENMNVNQIHGSPSLQTQMKDPRRKLDFQHGCLYGEDKLNDQNKNSNGIHESPCLQTQMKKLTRKLEFCDLKDDDNSSIHGKVASSGNPTARRGLCFDQQHQKRGSTDYLCSSPVSKKNLNFGGSNSAKAKGRCSLSGKSVKLMRRNRLKVFQDITLHPASP